MAKQATLHSVHGEMMTVAQAAGRLGVKFKTLEAYRTLHKKPDGSRLTLEEAYDRYIAFNAGEIARYPGRQAKRCAVHGEMVTVMDMARKLELSKNALYMTMRNHGWTLEQAVDYKEARTTEKAVKKIVGIISEK